MAATSAADVARFWAEHMDDRAQRRRQAIEDAGDLWRDLDRALALAG